LHDDNTNARSKVAGVTCIFMNELHGAPVQVLCINYCIGTYQLHCTK